MFSIFNCDMLLMRCRKNVAIHSFLQQEKDSDGGGHKMGQKQLERWYWETFNGGSISGGVFGRYYDHLHRALLRGMEELEHSCGAAVPELSGELIEAYLGQMKRITLRTLLLEMEICEEEGSLEGTAGQEKYACFEEEFLVLHCINYCE